MSGKGQRGKPGSGGGGGTVRQHSSTSDVDESPLKPPAKKACTENEDIIKAIGKLATKLDKSIADQQSFRASMETRLDNLKSDIYRKIAEECKSIRDDFQIEIVQLKDKMGTFDAKLSDFETTVNRDIETLQSRIKDIETTPFDPELTIVATGIRYNEH